MRVANHRKLLPMVGLAVPLLLACAWLVAAERGPFECNNGCQIDYPKPDPLTADYVQQMKPLFYRWFGDVFWNKGDTYIICNATYCALEPRQVLHRHFSLPAEGLVDALGHGASAHPHLVELAEHHAAGAFAQLVGR